MLIFPLKKEWYEKIKSGEKTIVYQKVKPIWARRIATTLCRPMFGLYLPQKVFELVSTIGFDRKFSACYPANKCLLRLRFTGEKLSAYISSIEVVNGKDTDLHIDKPVYAIHFTNVGGIYDKRRNQSKNKPMFFVKSKCF